MALYNDFTPLRQKLGSDRDFQKIKNYKVNASAKEFCKHNECEIFTEALELCYEIPFDKKPNYSKLVFILEKVLLDNNEIPEG